MPEHPAVAAASVVIDLMGSAEVADRWTEPSQLPGYDVGALTAHLGRSLETIRVYLEADAPAGLDLVDPARYFVAVLGDHDPRTSDFHAAVRGRGEAKAADGPAAVVAAARDDLAWWTAADVAPDRSLAVLNGVAMRFDQYLDTRLVEMLVHAHDLATSVGLPTPPFAEAAWRVVARLLAEVALLRHPASSVALRLARPEIGAIGAFDVPLSGD